MAVVWNWLSNVSSRVLQRIYFSPVIQWVQNFRCAWAVIPVAGTLMFAQLVTSMEVAFFLADRQRIERELCVMRDKAPEENTCHGQCYLMKRLRALEAAEEKPMSVQQVRLDPAIPLRTEWLPRVPVTRYSTAPAEVEGLLSLPRSPADPVPWG